VLLLLSVSECGSAAGVLYRWVSPGVQQNLHYLGLPNNIRLSNGTVELILTTDYGPRIMRYGFVGGRNFFKEFPDQLGKSGEPAWVPRGGHRVWIAPEDPVKSYALDNAPVEVRVAGTTMEAAGPIELSTGVQKKITVRMSETGTEVEVVHSLRNAGPAACDLAAWALTMMAPGGHGIHGFPPRGTSLRKHCGLNRVMPWRISIWVSLW
jgi:hypothetical protein